MKQKASKFVPLEIRLSKENQRLKDQIAFLKKYCEDLAFSYESAMGRLYKQVEGLEWQRICDDLFRLWEDEGPEAVVQRLNDWIKDSDSPERFKQVLDYINGLSIKEPLLETLAKKVKMKWALQDPFKLGDGISKSMQRRLKAQRHDKSMEAAVLQWPDDLAKMQAAVKKEKPLQWRDTLGRFIKEAKEKL